MPESAPLRRCLGTGGDATKSHFAALLGASHTAQKARGANPSITLAMGPSGAHFVAQLLRSQVNLEGLSKGTQIGRLEWKISAELST